ncbi:hypothetical protein [Trueperella pyogenes]
MDKCQWWEVSCNVSEWIAGGAETATVSVAKAVAGAAQWALELSGDFIVNISGVTAFNQAEVSWVQSTLSPFVALLATVSVLVAAMQMIWTQRGEPARELLASLIRLVVVSGAAMAGVMLMTQASDELAAWLIQSSGGDKYFMANMVSFINADAVLAVFVIILAGIIAIIGALVQAMLLLARGVFLTLLMGVLPLSAAASNTAWGKDWLRKTTGWVVAFILYKPAIAIILALGYRLMGSPTATQATMTANEKIREACGARHGQWEHGYIPFANESPNELGFNFDQWSQCADGIREQMASTGLDTGAATSFLQGLIIICFAAFAMPALIRFIMPASVAMSSGGGAALGAFAGGVASLAVAGGARHLGAVSTRSSGGSGSSGQGSGGPSGATDTSSSAGGIISGDSSAPSPHGGSSPSGASPEPSGAQGASSSGQVSAGGSAGPNGASGVSTAFVGVQMGAEVASGISNGVAAQMGEEA